MNFIQAKRAGLPGWITCHYGEYLGTWERVGAPEKPVFGTLIIRENGVWLRLVDALDELSMSAEMVDEGVILGHIEGGVDVTLVGCYEVKRRMSFSGHIAQSFSIDHLLLGARATTNDTFKLKSLDIEYAYLRDLYPNSAFDIESSDKGWNLKYLKPKALSAQLDQASVVFRQWGAINGEGDHLWKAEKKAFVSISLNEPMPIPAVVTEFLKPIRDLISLGVGAQSFIKNIRVVTEQFGDQQNKLQLLVRDDYQPQELQEPDYGRQLFRIDDLSKQFELHMTSWLAAQSNYKDILSLFFGVLYGKSMYQQNRFLNLSQAAEALGRVKSGRKKLQLRKCLDYLWEKADSVMIQIAPSKEMWLESVVNSRNYFTHYNPTKKNKALHGKELRRLEDQLTILLKSNFMGLLGFTTGQIAQLVSRLDLFTILKDEIMKRTDFA